MGASEAHIWLKINQSRGIKDTRTRGGKCKSEILEKSEKDLEHKAHKCTQM